MAEKKSELVKNIMVNLGVLLILVSTTATRDLGITPFFLGLILLAMQTVDFTVTDPKKFVTAEIIIASALSISTIIQLIMSRTFGSPQVFLIILLLGGLLITVEAVRKYADI